MIRRSILLSFLAVFLAAVPADAQVSVTPDVTFKSRYLFAGIVFWKGPMTRPTVTVSGTTGNWTLTGNGSAVYMHGDIDAIMELDAWGDVYYQATDRVGVYAGAGYYNFKDYLEEGEYAGSPEIYGGVVVYVPLTPTLYVAKEFELNEGYGGTHATLTLSHSVPLSENGLALSLVGNLDYNHEYYWDDSGFSYADLEATLAIPVGPVTISPLAGVQLGIADEGYGIENYFGNWGWFGVSASMTF